MSKKNKKQKRSKRKVVHPNRTPSVKFHYLPDNQSYSLRFNTRYQVSGTAYSVYNFDALELTTLQPMYRDQLLALWRRYVVLGCTIEHRIVNKSSTVDLEFLTYHGSGTTVAALTFSQALEYKHTKRVMVTSSGNNKSITVTRTIDLRRFLPPKYYEDSDFWGTSADKPGFCVSSDGYQFASAFYSADGTSTMAATMDRRITFHVKLFELAPVANSLDFVANEKPVFNPPPDDVEVVTKASIIPRSKHFR